MSAVTPTPEGIAVNVRVVPRASRTEVAGLRGDAVRIRLQAPPVDGKANKLLVRFLAKTLGVSPRRIVLAAGEASRTKRVLISGASAREVEAKLLSGTQR